MRDHSLEVIAQCGNMWYNPKLPMWAREMKGGTGSLVERQQMASADSSMCQLTGGARGEAKNGKAKKVGTAAARDVESFLLSKRRTFRDGKRTVRQTEAGAAYVLLESGKRKRQEKLKRERVAMKRRDDEGLALSKTNQPIVSEALQLKGGAGVVGWRVRVWWPDEHVWFYGTVRSFHSDEGKHLVEYEDGDTQQISLSGGVEKVGFLKAPRAVNKNKAVGPKKPKRESTPTRKSGRTPKIRTESPPPPPGGLRGSHGIRKAAAARRLSDQLANVPKRARSAR